VGYNLKATDIQAALGVSQFQKLDHFVLRRKENFKYLMDGLKGVEGLQMPIATKNSDPSWFGFPITIDPKHPANREDLLRFLEERKIGTRLMFAGNITRQPGYANVDFRIVGSLSNSDTIMTRAFWLGVYPGLTIQMLEYVIDSIRAFMDRY
jgi:CDP-6-deoxy-D-xylo-4-hexulose-3-dehydrase